MRRLVALIAFLLAVAPAFVADPPKPDDKPKPKLTDPPAWTFQIRSVADLTAALHPIAAAYHHTDDHFAAWLEDTFGEPGLKGIDPTRPVVGTIRPGQSEEDGSVVFVAIPITDAAEFLKLLDRADLDPTPLKKHPGVTEFVWHRETCHVRFTKTHALVVCNGTPADLDPKLTPDPAALFDATATNVATITLHPARLDDTLKAALMKWPLNLTQFVQLGYVEVLPTELDPPVGQWAGGTADEFFTGLVKEADKVTVQFTPVGEGKALGVELVVTPKKGTALAKRVAKPTDLTHAFASLRDDPELVEVTLAKVPASGHTVEQHEKVAEKLTPPVWDPSTTGKEFVPVLNALHTVVVDALPGGADVIQRTTGPDKDEKYTTLYAASVSDTGKLGKAVLALLADPPASFGEFNALAKAVKTPAAKAGDTPIYALPLGDQFDESLQSKYGKEPMVAFAWTKAVVAVAWGPDAVGQVKQALEAKPGEVARVQVRANPKRADEFHRIGWIGDDGFMGKYGSDADEVRDMLTVGVATDGDLRVRLTIRHEWLRRQNQWSQLDGFFNILGWPW